LAGLLDKVRDISGLAADGTQLVSDCRKANAVGVDNADVAAGLIEARFCGPQH
jgi:hypothetical protein